MHCILEETSKTSQSNCSYKKMGSYLQKIPAVLWEVGSGKKVHGCLVEKYLKRRANMVLMFKFLGLCVSFMNNQVMIVVAVFIACHSLLLFSIILVKVAEGEAPNSCREAHA